jgi:hypothetical protein
MIWRLIIYLCPLKQDTLAASTTRYDSRDCHVTLSQAFPCYLRRSQPSAKTDLIATVPECLARAHATDFGLLVRNCPVEVESFDVWPCTIPLRQMMLGSSDCAASFTIFAIEGCVCTDTRSLSVR